MRCYFQNIVQMKKAGEVIRLTPCNCIEVKRLYEKDITLIFIGIMLIACSQKTVSVREVWTKEQANEWYKQWGWLRGCDFIPSTAINQMEM